MGLSYPEQSEKGSAAPGRKWVQPLQITRTPETAWGPWGVCPGAPRLQRQKSMAEMKTF